MITREITIAQKKDSGKIIPLLVQKASQYKSTIHFTADSKTVNAKSIMGMLNFGVVSGVTITAEIDGEDEEEAMNGIVDFLA